MALAINSLAPDFELPDSNGRPFRLSKELKGQLCIIYFYPKDFTPGCTKEACHFRDSHALLQELDVRVIGISRDSVDTHRQFQQAYQLPFDLLSDTSGAVCKKYDALIPILGMPKRITYLLNAEHRIVAVYENLFDAEGHLKKMIASLKK